MGSHHVATALIFRHVLYVFLQVAWEVFYLPLVVSYFAHVARCPGCPYSLSGWLKPAWEIQLVIVLRHTLTR